MDKGCQGWEQEESSRSRAAPRQGPLAGERSAQCGLEGVCSPRLHECLNGTSAGLPSAGGGFVFRPHLPAQHLQVTVQPMCPACLGTGQVPVLLGSSGGRAPFENLAVPPADASEHGRAAAGAKDLPDGVGRTFIIPVRYITTRLSHHTSS